MVVQRVSCAPVRRADLASLFRSSAKGRSRHFPGSPKPSSGRMLVLWGQGDSGWCGVGGGEGGQGGGPAVLECGEEAGFDFGGDVGVDVVDFVGEFVAESSGLGDVGDSVGDEPGFVAVAESVEGQAGEEGW